MPFASLLKSPTFAWCHAIISNTASMIKLNTNLRHLHRLNGDRLLMGYGTLIVPWNLNAAATSRSLDYLEMLISDSWNHGNSWLKWISVFLKTKVLLLHFIFLTLWFIKLSRNIYGQTLYKCDIQFCLYKKGSSSGKSSSHQREKEKLVCVVTGV